MFPTEALVTLARRYCRDNFEYWCKEYDEKRAGNDFPYTYTDGDYDLFPRYNVLRAILLEVETLVGGDFSSLSECRECLLVAGQTAETIFTTGEKNAIALKAMNEERDKFLSSISSITDDALADVEPLPYSRHLLQSEASEVRKQLFRQWNFDGGYWEPLVSCSPKPVLFLAMDNISPDDCEAIKEIVRGHAYEQLYRITEDRIDYQIDASLFDPFANETIYCDARYDWVVYGSHEGTAAFGGEYFVSYIRQLYQDRTELINLMLKMTLITEIDCP